MPKTEFESIDEIKEAVRALVEFAEAAVYGRLLEMTHESNLFHVDDERLDKLARIIEPDLNKEPDPETIFNRLSLDDDDRLLGLLSDFKEGFFTMGIFLGACIADHSGSTLAKLGQNWIRAKLAQPRHAHLQECKRRRPKRGK